MPVKEGSARTSSLDERVRPRGKERGDTPLRLRDDEVVHGIPGPRVSEDGNLVSPDCGLILDGWWADSRLSVACGEASPEVTHLIEVTRQALDGGIAAAPSGNTIGDIGHAIQIYAEGEGYSPVREYVGHGIGRNMHEPPQVPNHGQTGVRPGHRPMSTRAARRSAC